MASSKDAQRYRKIYSYYRPQPRAEVFGSGPSEALINGLDWKHSVLVATIANITLSPAPASIDGVNLGPEDRVLVKDQTTASENGLYYLDSGTGDLVRTNDGADGALTAAAAVFVEEGVTNGGCAFVLVTPDPITVGSTSLSWVKFAGAGSSIFTSSLSPEIAKTIYSVSIDTENRYANELGDDVFFFVSGSIDAASPGDDKKSLFGGDLVVSGNLTSRNGLLVEGGVLEMTGSLLVTGSLSVTGTITTTHGFSGSLTNLGDGSSYIIAGPNITINTGSNGSVEITGSAGGGASYFFSTTAGSVFTTGSTAFAGQDGTTTPSDKGADVFFYVSGSIDAKDGLTPGVSLFGGDLVVSGTFFGVGDSLEMTGSISATQGLSGSLTRLTDGTSYLIAGNNVTITSQSNGPIVIASSGGGSGGVGLQFLAGKLSSTSPSGSMESVGMDYLDTTSLPPTPTYTFSAILAPTTGTTAYMDLYDYDGIIGGTPGPIAGSVLTGSSLSYTHLTADVSTALSLAGSSGIIEARIWCSPTGSGLNAICKSAKLTIA